MAILYEVSFHICVYTIKLCLLKTQMWRRFILVKNAVFPEAVHLRPMLSVAPCDQKL